VRAAALVAAALLVVPAVPAALEPRFDHRDTQGPLVELFLAHDTVAVSGEPTESSWRPALRLAYGFDVSGVGDELIVGGSGSLRDWDEDRERVDFALDARYRAYFGTEELKTFFDVGVWSSVRQRFAIGPLVGLGLAYDFSRAIGAFASGLFSTGFGGARIASFGASAGLQLRFE
jgi:hypothetical protein